jgi:geranylgeranyl diphosphate synthase type II
LITEKRFNEIIKREKVKVENILTNALNNRKPQSLYMPSNYILNSHGKRLRPLLILLSTKAVGGKYSDAYNAAAAVEILHNFTLVHDDIMDNADKRRGRLTIHKKYDVSTAILVGDALLSIAFEYLLKDCKRNTHEIVTTFNHGILEVCEGQSMDKDFECRKDVSLPEYLCMIRKKTAALAEMCCHIGALIGNGDKKEVKALSNFGMNIGLAFQIQDDLLDVIGSENDLGKKIGGDLLEGKKTYLFLRALEKAEGNTKSNLLKAMRNKGIQENEIDTYRKLYFDLGVIEDAQLEIKKYTEKAINELKILKQVNDKTTLEILAKKLLSRNK